MDVKSSRCRFVREEIFFMRSLKVCVGMLLLLAHPQSESVVRGEEPQQENPSKVSQDLVEESAFSKSDGVVQSSNLSNPSTDVVRTKWSSNANLPADAGQVWKTYDITPFVNRVGPGSQKHIVDWILQDSGYATWHGSTVAAMGADEKKLVCFHTAEIQSKIEEIASRFTSEASASHRFSVRIVGIGDPSWRSTARGVLRSIPASTPGVQAWMVPREEAAIFLATLRQRRDYQELPAGPVLAANGQPATIGGGKPRDYVKDVVLRPDVAPGWQTETGRCDEGLAIDVHPLISKDEKSVEAVLRCRIDQIERMSPVTIDLPLAQRQRVKIEVPQFSTVRIGEHFSWPASNTLIVGMGTVPWPVPNPVEDQPSLLTSAAKRADLLVLIEPRLANP